MPIIVGGGRNRTGKVASEITAKGFVLLKIWIIMDLKYIQWQILDPVQFRVLTV